MLLQLRNATLPRAARCVLLAIAVCGMLPSAGTRAQDASLTLMPYYQQWTLQAGGGFSQGTVLAALSLPVTRDIAFSASAIPFSTGGDYSHVSGMSDAQLSISWSLPAPRLVFTLGVNAPSGKTQLTRDEFLTGVLLSNPVFGMRVPQFGQGWNIDPGVLYALSFGENTAAGLGLSYRMQGKFHPVQSIGEYDPGDELLATGGLETKLAEGEVVSADVIVTAFGRDVLEGEEVFRSGTKIVAGLQYGKYFGYSRLLVSGRYRSTGRSLVSVAGALVTVDQNVEPANAELLASWSMRLSNALSATVLAEGRRFTETAAAISGISIFTAGLSAEWKLSPAIAIPISAMVHSGSMKGSRSISGFEGGAGVKVTM